MDSVLEVITRYGLDTAIFAIVTTVLTGILKYPVKKLAQKLTNRHAVTRFITFLPVIIGFGITALGSYLLSGAIPFGEQSFYIQWVSAASLSLTIYAFWEKFVPSKKKTLTDSEIKENLELLKQVKQAVERAEIIQDRAQECDTEKAEVSVQEIAEEKAEAAGTIAASETAVAGLAEKIILTGGTHVKFTKEQ